MSLSPPSSPASPRTSVPAALFVVIVLVVAGVAIAGTAAYYELNPKTTSPGPHSVTVVDDLGRTSSVPLDPRRVVVLAPNVMDIVYRLGLRSDVVGVGCTPSIEGGILNEYSYNQTIQWNLNNSICVTDFPSLDTEGVANLSAQVVLASTITSAEDVQTLTDTYGIPVVILAPTSLEGIIGDVRIISEIFPEVDTVAANLEAELESGIQNASNFVQNLSDYDVNPPSVLLTYYFETGASGGYYSFGSGTFGDSLISYAGGLNLAAGIAAPYGELNGSYVYDKQPQYILYATSWNDPYLVSGETPDVWNTTAPYWNSLNGTKIGVDVTVMTEADPTMIFALPYLEQLLYPGLAP